MSIDPQSFTVVRQVAARPATVFRVATEKGPRRAWFVDDDSGEWETLDYALDFRVGGSERARFRHKGTTLIANDTVFFDIVPAARVVLAYGMTIDGARISTSLATMTFEPSGDGTRLTYLEQAVFLDGKDTVAQREGGCAWLMDRLKDHAERAQTAQDGKETAR